jgi:hypothetical protein
MDRLKNIPRHSWQLPGEVGKREGSQRYYPKRASKRDDDNHGFWPVETWWDRWERRTGTKPDVATIARRMSVNAKGRK